MEKKITLKEFWESDKELAIHCDTEVQANKLTKEFDKLGANWINNNYSYLDDNGWQYYTNKTLYTNDGCVTSLDFSSSKKYKIYEFVDLAV